MNIEIFKSKIFENEFKKAKETCFILYPQDYATDVTNLIIECEGINNCYNHAKSFQNVDISKYLDIIKGAEEECVLILAISNKIEDIFIIHGENDRIYASSYFEKNDNSLSAIEFVSSWYHRGAKLCNYHNHPLRIAAIPSDSDINSFCFTDKIKKQEDNEWCMLVEKYKIDYPIGFKYSDWGIVTSFDFFSYSQYINQGSDIETILIYNEKNRVKKEEILRKYDLDN